MPADLAVLGARLRTMDPDRPFATALAVRNGLIVAVGDDAEVKATCDGTTEVFSAAGWSVTPGLTDGHQHLFMGAELGRGVDLDRIATLDGVLDAIAEERCRVGSDAWIRGFALEYAAFGGRPFHHTLVDAAAGDGPMLIYSLDLHTAFANAHALRLAGVTGQQRFADGASIVCDDQGKPTGELREMTAIRVVADQIPEPTRAERLEWYADAIRRQNAVGITGLHQMDGTFETAEVLAELESSRRLNVRVALHYFIDPATEPEVIDTLTRAPAPRGRYWHGDGVKFMLDGVVETGTAWLEEPDELGGGAEPLWPDPSRYAETARRFHESGYRVATHAIGDRAVRTALDTYASLPGSAGRHRIEHIETAPDATVARFAPQDVIASMQPIHLRWLKPDLSDPWSQRLGQRRCAHAMRSGDLQAAGALVVLGSDWPVAPFDPRLGMFAAQLRRAPDLADEGPVGASRPLSGAQALAGYTINAARAVGEEEFAGMLRPGCRADFVAWGLDPADCPPEDVTELPVLATVIDGRVVHRAD